MPPPLTGSDPYGAPSGYKSSGSGSGYGQVYPQPAFGSSPAGSGQPGPPPSGSGQGSGGPTGPSGSEPGAAGPFVLWIDDQPEGNRRLVEQLRGGGALVLTATSTEEAATMLDRRGPKPDFLISDISRGDDPDAGLDGLAELRRGGYAGAAAFFTGRITPERRRRATDLGALISSSWAEVLAELDRATRR